MAEILVSHRPELTVEQAIDLFSRQFAGDYEVYKYWGPGRDFVVKKNGRTAVGVRLKQQENQTSFVFTPFTPSILFNLLFGGLLSYILLRPGWKRLEGEVGDFIQSSSEIG